eukprot:scaffold4531_cov103-Cylindrotheca_fusiformis.AAC.14
MPGLLSLSAPSSSMLFDTIIVGGSTAGLSAALALCRSVRSVLIVDAGEPCNRPADHSHNLLGFDGVPPMTIRERGIADVSAYPTAQWKIGTASEFKSNDSTISIAIKEENKVDTQWVEGRKLIIATGLKDILPDGISGLRECWGTSVIHCPYCHGYEYANKRTALFNMEPSAVLHMAPMLWNLSKELFVVCPLDSSPFSEEELATFEKNGVILVDGKVKSIKHTDGMLEALVLEDKTELAMDVAYIRQSFEHRFPSIPGLDIHEMGFIDVDRQTQKTSVPNVYACGDCTDFQRSLSIVLASGMRAATAVNYELSMEEWNKK